MKLIMENWRRFLVGEAQWSNSEDFDYPAERQPKYAKNLESNRVLTFNQNETYSLSGDTHGKDSHMIKHHVEFFPDQVKAMAQQTLELINNTEQDTYIISGGAPQKIEKSQIKLGDILNLYDLINDKKLNGENLEEIEKIIYSKHMTPLVNRYDGMVDNMMGNAVDVSNEAVKTKENLIKILSKQPIVSFKAMYSGNEENYFVNTKDSSMVVASGTTVATLFRRTKKAPGKSLTLRQTLKDFASGKSTEPTDEYSLFRDYIDSLKAPQQTPTKKQQQPRRPKTQINPVDLAKTLSSKGLPKDKIKDIIMKKFNKPEKAALGIMKGAGI